MTACGHGCLAHKPNSDQQPQDRAPPSMWYVRGLLRSKRPSSSADMVESLVGWCVDVDMGQKSCTYQPRRCLRRVASGD